MSARLAAAAIAALVLALLPSPAAAGGLDAEIALEADAGPNYLGVDPLAPLAALKKGSPYADALVPLASNLEYGAEVHYGRFLTPTLAPEVRVAVGPWNYTLIPQLHAGVHWFPGEALGWGEKGPFVGGFLRYWDYYNRATEVHHQNVAATAHLGWWWSLGRFTVDVRAHFLVAIASWSSLDHTRPAAAFIGSPMPAYAPILPVLGTNVGYRF